jgi:small subunit ribosomal protein S2
MEKLEKVFGGIADMDGLPDALFIVDVKKEQNAILEAKKLNIPVIGILDTNCDPDDVNYKLPGNDDAIRSIRLFCQIIADSVMEAKYGYLPPDSVFIRAAEEAEEEARQNAEKAKPTAVVEEFEAVVADIIAAAPAAPAEIPPPPVLASDPDEAPAPAVEIEPVAAVPVTETAAVGEPAAADPVVETAADPPVLAVEEDAAADKAMEASEE